MYICRCTTIDKQTNKQINIQQFMKKLTLIIGLVATVFLLITACTKEKEKAPKPYDYRTQWVGQYNCTGYSVVHHYYGDTAHHVQSGGDYGCNIHLTAHNANDSLLIADIREYIVFEGEREYASPLSVEFKVNTSGNFALMTNLGWYKINGFFFDNDSIFFTTSNYDELTGNDLYYDTIFYKGVRVSRQ